MNCPTCGAEADKSLALCPHCGAKLKRHLSDTAAALLSRDVELPSLEEEAGHAADSVYVGLISEEAPTEGPAPLPALEPVAVEHISPQITEELVQEHEVAPTTSEANSETSPVAEENLRELLSSISLDDPQAPSALGPEAADKPAEQSEVVRPAEEPEPTLVDEVVRPRSRKERKARRARLRTMRAARKRGVEQQGDPHLHTHDFDQAAVAAPVRSAGAVDEHRKLRRVLSRTIGVMAVLIGIAFLLLFSWEAEWWGGRTLPDVRGMTSSDATALLSDKGFSASVTQVPSDDSFGLVVSESPAPGERVSQAESVVLGIASKRVVPDVVGISLEEAQAQLEKQGLTRIELIFSDSSENDTAALDKSWKVKTVTPGVSTEVTANTVIVLVLEAQ